MAYDVLDNVYSIFMDVKTGVGGSSGSNTFYNTDVNTSFIEIILTERDKNLTMTDYTYIVSVDKADGTSYVNRYTASEANKMSIKLDTQLLACVGECTAQLYVLKDDKVRTMMEFNYFVKNGVFDGAKPPSHNEDSIYISLMKEFTDLKENVLIAIGKMDGIESSIESVKNIADTNTNTINSEKKKTEANTSAIEEQSRSITEINNTLQTHSDKIQASEETITQHTEKLQGHDRKLEEYNGTIQEHGRTLESQGASITEQGEKISKNETDITQNKKDIKANTAEINKAKTATTGEKFGSVSERIDAEVSRINNKIEVSFVPQEEAESHTILNTVEGMSTDMVIKGRTLQNLVDVRKMVLGDSSKEITFENDIIKFKKAYSNEITYLKVPFLSKPNTTYTIIYDVIKNNVEQPDESKYIIYPDGVFGDFNSTMNTFPQNGQTGLNKFCLNTKSTLFGKFSLGFHRVNIGAEIWIKDLMILEGDWTNKPIPSYFEGIKSFGQQEDKISILSHGKNLVKKNSFTNDEIKKWNGSDESYYVETIDSGLKRGTLWGYIESTGDIRYELSFGNNPIITTNQESITNTRERVIQYINSSARNTLDKDYKYAVISVRKLSEDASISKVMISNVETNYEPYKEYKKDILLSELGFDEGLRGLNNLVYDELNSISGVAVKRVDKKILNSEWNWMPDGTINEYGYIRFYTTNIPLSSTSTVIDMCDKLPTLPKNDRYDKNGITRSGAGFFEICLNAELIGGSTPQNVKDWLKQNPLSVYFPLMEPVETPLTDPINVKTFNEKTYVSFLNALKGTSSFKTPVDTIQTIARLTSENKSLLSSNVELDAKVTEAMKKNQQLKEEAIATQSALDYILMNTLKA